jgi:hypothetical protein
MPKVSRPIPSLLNGVSQQPPSVRRASQGQLQINGLSSLVDGLVKRPPSQHLAKLSGTPVGSAYIHTINWSSSERFVIVLVDNDLYAYDFDGNSKTVNFPAGKTYLDVADALNDFAAVTVGDTTYITNKTTITTTTGATAGGTLLGEVQTFAALPGTPAGGDTYKITGDDTLFVTGYYVQWDATNAVWKEVARPGVSTTLDATTMPHKLTYNSGTGQFTFDVETWDVRAAGDLTSRPEPSFLARTIRDVFFHRNRLGMLAGEYCVLSRSGPSLENFWSQTATALLDSDPIDVRAANIRASTMYHAVPTSRQLMMFGEKTQFIMSTDVGQLLTPSTAAIDVATTYASNAIAKPVTAGSALYFPADGALFSSLREYYLSSDSQSTSNVAEDVTAHVPQYVPAGTFKLAVAEDEDVLFLLTTGDQTRIYVYKYFWLNEEKVQSAWSYWQFDANDTILSIDVIDSSLYSVIERADGIHLHRIDLTGDPSLADLGFVCHLDKRVLLTGVYNSGTDETTWTMPYTVTGSPDLDIRIVKGGGFVSPGEYGALIPGAGIATATTVSAPGDHSAHPCYIGIPYTFTYRFSEQFVRDGAATDDNAPAVDGRLHLLTMAIRYSQTGYFRAEVTPRPGASLYSYSFNGMVLGEPDLVIGTPQVTTGDFRFPLLADSKRVTIDLINDTHMPCRIVNAEWVGNFTYRAGRR